MGEPVQILTVRAIAEGGGVECVVVRRHHCDDHLFFHYQDDIGRRVQPRLLVVQLRTLNFYRLMPGFPELNVDSGRAFCPPFLGVISRDRCRVRLGRHEIVFVSAHGQMPPLYGTE